MVQVRDLNRDGEETTTGGELLMSALSLAAVAVIAVVGTFLLEKTTLGSEAYIPCGSEL